MPKRDEQPQKTRAQQLDEQFADTDEESHREFMMQLCRNGVNRARLMETEIAIVGVALKGRLIDSETAVRWLRDAQLLDFVGQLPAQVGRLSKPMTPTTSTKSNDETEQP
jgi:hypothetical protein